MTISMTLWPKSLLVHARQNVSYSKFLPLTMYLDLGAAILIKYLQKQRWICVARFTMVSILCFSIHLISLPGQSTPSTAFLSRPFVCSGYTATITMKSFPSCRQYSTHALCIHTCSMQARCDTRMNREEWLAFRSTTLHKLARSASRTARSIWTMPWLESFKIQLEQRQAQGWWHIKQPQSQIAHTCEHNLNI